MQGKCDLLTLSMVSYGFFPIFSFQFVILCPVLPQIPTGQLDKCMNVVVYSCSSWWSVGVHIELEWVHTATGSDVAVLPGDRTTLPGAVEVRKGLVVMMMYTLNPARLKTTSTGSSAHPPWRHPPVNIAHFWCAVPHRGWSEERNVSQSVYVIQSKTEMY